MKTYIINLERSVERKIYMGDILGSFPFLDFEFVAAVDGRVMSESERSSCFNIDQFKQRYSVDVRPGEIGCTLSHQKCYRKMVTENEPYVLILEDDIVRPTQDIREVLERIERMVATDEPRIILLSGWYWFTKVQPLSDNYRMADVFDAFLTHSYVINQAAAKVLIEERPFITADDWRYIRRKGVRLQAVFPHLINQNWDGELATTVNVEQSRCKSISWYCRNACRLACMKFLKVIGHFEKA